VWVHGGGAKVGGDINGGGGGGGAGGGGGGVAHLRMGWGGEGDALTFFSWERRGRVFSQCVCSVEGGKREPSRGVT